MPRISLIVCTYNRADILPRCLLAARNQNLPASEYEVIVVDNASGDHTAPVVQRIAGVRYLYCARRGLSNARNAGAHAARTPIVTFIDDDAIADPNLLREILRVFDTHEDAGCAGGKIRLCLPPNLPAWYSTEFAGYYSEFDPGHSDIQRITEMDQFPFGANISFRREVLERVGYFSEILGRIGHDSGGGEELDLEYRVFRAGYGIYYTPFASVEHVIMPGRIRWSHVASTARAAGRNWAYYEIELFRSGLRFREDFRKLLSALAGMLARGRFWVAYSQALFYRAKLFSKMRRIGS